MAGASGLWVPSTGVCQEDISFPDLRDWQPMRASFHVSWKSGVPYSCCTLAAVQIKGAVAPLGAWDEESVQMMSCLVEHVLCGQGDGDTGLHAVA